ncbi:THP2 domain protein [Ceratobasidium sp. AG-Ba]|nr:THP2 domain protein [Ceratobasidium sp. AG-Ba]QRW12420.1 THP2 domain protein [Ceratobasidium sp. AG-Ba]
MSESTETPLPPSPPIQNAEEITTTTTTIVEPQTPRPPSPAASVAETTRAGPSRNGRGSSYQAPDQASINNLVNGFTNTLESLDQSLKMLMTNARDVEALGPPPDPAAQIHKLRLQLRAQDKKQDQRIADIKHIVKDVLKEQIADHMRAQIQEQIRLEIAEQVRAAVHEQMPEHLPVSLQEQADESKRQLIEVRHSLLNSEARRSNATLRSTNLDDPLAPVVKPNGEESALAPETLRQLFSYDSAQARALVRDYGLREHDVRERNLNRFMAHIGVQFNLIPIPVMVDGVVDENGAPIGVTLI